MILRGTVYVEGELRRRYIEIEDGKILSVSTSKPAGHDVIECDGVILPGGIDMHVHFRDPGMTEKEDFFTGTKSAAFGGITTVMDMPNNQPPTDDTNRLKKKIKNVGKKSCIDFGLYGLVGKDNEKMLKQTSFFKVYMAPSTDTDGSYSPDEIEKILKSGGKVAFHCEDKSLFTEPGEDLPGHNRHRPVESELSAIKKLKELPAGNKHVCHATTIKSIGLARKVGCTVEVTPHHLFLNEEALLNTRGKVNPPLRGSDQQFYLWEAFERGDIDILASDHAPHLESEKDTDFEKAPSGLPGVETMYPLLLNSVAYGNISLSTVVKALSERPAELLELKKGRIAEGYDADLIVADFRESENISVSRLHSKAGWSPFEGFRAIFPRHVISHGEFVVKDRKFVGEKGKGEYISGQST